MLDLDIFGKLGKEVTQIKMAIYEVPNFTTGVDGVLVEVAETVPIFIPMFLVFVFGIVFIGGITANNG